MIGERFDHRSAAGLFDAECARHRLRHEVRVAQRRELDQPRAIGKLMQHLPRELERHAALADAAGAEEREQARARKELRRIRELAVAADEGSELQRQIVRQAGERVVGSACPFGQHLPEGDRLLDVFQPLAAGKACRDLQPALHALVERLAHAHAPRRGLRLQTRGDVHAVAVDAAVGLLDHIAEMDADTNTQAALFGRLGRAAFERALHRERRVHCAARALEEREHRVARHVDDAPGMRLDLAPKKRARLVERRDRGAGIGGHQPRVAGDIGGENRRQSLA